VKKSLLAKDSLDKMLEDLFSTKDQMATDVSICVCCTRGPRQIHFLLMQFLFCSCSSSINLVLILQMFLLLVLQAVTPVTMRLLEALRN